MSGTTCWKVGNKKEHIEFLLGQWSQTPISAEYKVVSRCWNLSTMLYCSIHWHEHHIIPLRILQTQISKK